MLVLGCDGDVRGDVSEDEDDDGRGLVSAGWGTGHDGSAIEILNVQFVPKPRSIPGLRTRSQRLLEYAERRAGVLGLAHSFTRGATSRLAGRKRRRGWDWPSQHFRHLPNASVLDIILEQEEETEAVDGSVHFVDESFNDENARMNVHTVVFGFGLGGEVQAGYKYDPVVLKGVLFPDGEDDLLPPKKRRRIDPSEKAEWATDVELDDTLPSPSYAKNRPVILETAKESYLLSSSVPANVGGPQTYDIALILEAEVEEEPIAEVNPASSTLSTDPHAGSTKKTLSVQPIAHDLTNSGLRKSTLEGQGVISPNLPRISLATNGEGTTLPRHTNPIAQSTTNPTLPTPPTLSSSERQQDEVGSPSRRIASDAPPTTVPMEAAVAEPSRLTKAVEPSSLPEILPSSRRASFVYGDASKPLLLQTLQCNLEEEMFQFLKEGVKVADGLNEDGTQSDWMVQVRRWKWGPITS